MTIYFLNNNNNKKNSFQLIEEIAEDIQEVVTLSKIDRAFTARHFHQHKYCWPVPVLRYSVSGFLISFLDKSVLKIFKAQYQCLICEELRARSW